MKGIDLERIHEVILDVFDIDEFSRLLRFRFDYDISKDVGNVGFSSAAMTAITKAEKKGWLPELIAEVARERPKRPDVQAVYCEFAAALVALSKRRQVDAEVAAAYAKFGLAPPVAHQQAGVTAATLPVTDSGLERTIRDDLGYLDVALWRDRLFRLEGRVCRVELNDTVGTMGTGFLVGPDALLTNYHVLQKVIEGQHGAAAVQFRFDYKALLNGQTADGVLIGLAASEGATRPWLLGQGKYSAAEKANTPDNAPPAAGELDYALVRLARKLGEEPVGPDGPVRGWVEVPTAPPQLAGLPAIMILQHPNRAPLKLAFDTRPNIELRHNGLRVRYATNTEGGSSGSPVFDKDWKLVALHHYGDPAFSQPKYNQGVPIGMIRDHLNDAAREALGGAVA